MTITNRNIIILITYTLVVLAIVFIAFGEISLADGLTPPTTVNTQPTSIEQNPIILWINWAINMVSALILAGSVVMITIAGIQYTSARDNAQSVQAAKQRITNVVLGILAYFMLYGFVQWVVPGGVF